MLIRTTDRFEAELFAITEFIARDNIEAASRFKTNVLTKLKTLSFSPYKYRKSLYFDSELIRDMIFRRYTIVYRVDEPQEIIEILRIFGQNKPS